MRDRTRHLEAQGGMTRNICLTAENGIREGTWKEGMRLVEGERKEPCGGRSPAHIHREEMEGNNLVGEQAVHMNQGSHLHSGDRPNTVIQNTEDHHHHDNRSAGAPGSRVVDLEDRGVGSMEGYCYAQVVVDIFVHLHDWAQAMTSHPSTYGARESVAFFQHHSDDDQKSKLGPLAPLNRVREANSDWSWPLVVCLQRAAVRPELVVVKE